MLGLILTSHLAVGGVWRGRRGGVRGDGDDNFTARRFGIPTCDMKPGSFHYFYHYSRTYLTLIPTARTFCTAGSCLGADSVRCGTFDTVFAPRSAQSGDITRNSTYLSRLASRH